VSLSEAEAKAGFAILRPDDPSASDGSISHVWLDRTPGLGYVRVAISYASGIEETIQPYQFPDPKEEFTSLASELPGASVETVGGVPALVIPPGSDSTGSHIGSVAFVLEDDYVVIYGYLSVDALKTVADSIDTSA